MKFLFTVTIILFTFCSRPSCHAFDMSHHRDARASPSQPRGKAFSIALNDETSAAAESNYTIHMDAFDLEEETELLHSKSKFSKAKWKKKRFLLIQDVKRLIDQNHPHAPKKAEEMVRRMLTLYEKSGNDVELRPTLQAYNLWIHAIAKSRDSNAGQMAEQVLEQMYANHVSPDVITYTSIMDAYARSQNPDRAEEVLFQLLESTIKGKVDGKVGLSSITCDTILNAWAQQGTYESAQRAQTILLRLEEWQRNDIRPTKVSYATVMNAWARVGTTEAAEHAEMLLNSMLKKSKVQPDTVVFNAAINAWAASRDQQAGKRALAILRTMKTMAKEGLDSRPDIVTYNTVLSAWSHSGDINAAPYTEKIVQEMQTASAESNEALVPNTVTFNTILNAWAKSKLPGAAIRAQKVLDYMIKSENKGIAPDAISFGSVLDAWAKSKEANKSTQCRDLLDRLLQMYNTTQDKALQPTPHTYNAVLNACAFSALGTSVDEQRDALQIAVKTFSSMRKSGTPPDTVTYGNMLKCLANLMPEGDVRTNMALQLFDLCISDGLVGALVWNEVRRAVPAKQLAKVYHLSGPIGSIQVRDLPKKWRQSNQSDKNAPPTKREAANLETDDPLRRNAVPTRTIVETSVQSGKDL